MRAAIVGPVYPYRGGIAHFTMLLVRKMLDLGHTVEVFSFRRQYPRFLYPGASDRDPSAQPLAVPAQYPLDPLYPWTWLRAVQVIRRSRPQVVVIMWWTTFWGPALAFVAASLRASGIPVLYVIHNVLPHERKFYDAPLAKLALKQGSGYIVQSERERQRLDDLLGEARASVCPHPIYDQFSAARLTKSEARRALGLDAEAPLALFFGIIRPYKGLAHLLRALSRLSDTQDGKRIHLLVAGEFWDDKQVYLDLIEQLGLSVQVHVYDYYIPNEVVAQLFSAADVFVAPYTGGTQSGVVKIAMSFGLPLVVSQMLYEGDEMVRGYPGVWVASPGPEVAPGEGFERALAEGMRTALAQPNPGSFSGQDSHKSWLNLIETVERLAG